MRFLRSLPVPTDELNAPPDDEAIEDARRDIDGGGEARSLVLALRLMAATPAMLGYVRRMSSRLASAEIFKDGSLSLSLCDLQTRSCYLLVTVTW